MGFQIVLNHSPISDLGVKCPHLQFLRVDKRLCSNPTSSNTTSTNSRSRRGTRLGRARRGHVGHHVGRHVWRRVAGSLQVFLAFSPLTHWHSRPRLTAWLPLLTSAVPRALQVFRAGCLLPDLVVRCLLFIALVGVCTLARWDSEKAT